jgi:putative oxidoreductase
MPRIDSVLRRITVALTILMIVLSLHAFMTKPIELLTMLSISLFLILLAVSTRLIWRSETRFFAYVGALLFSLIVGRLFSTMRFEMPGGTAISSLDPLLVTETGPGIDSIMYTSVALLIVLSLELLRFAWLQTNGTQSEGAMGRPSANDWGMTFLRIYVGLMFIAHFAGHLFAGSAPFAVFVDYFGSIGLPYPGAFVILAGIIELAVTIGLAFGFMTRIAAAGAAIYLFVSVWLGGHFAVGYVWVLPTGGWEFPALWIFAVSLFVMTGAGPASVDWWLKRKFTKLSKLARLALA